MALRPLEEGRVHVLGELMEKDLVLGAPPLFVHEHGSPHSAQVVSGVSKEDDIAVRTRAFAMDELHYGTMAASCLDFNAKMTTTAPVAAGQGCVSN